MCRARLIPFFIFQLLHLANGQNGINGSRTVNVGVVLNMETMVGRMGNTCMSMALQDFYAKHSNYITRIALRVRDSQREVVGAATQALDLVKNEEVQAIIGPQTSEQAKFVTNIGNECHIPVVSFSATSPSLSSTRTPYFVRTAQDDSAQVSAIAAVVQALGWRQVVVAYEDSECGKGMMPYLIDALQEIEVGVSFRSILHPSSTSQRIIEELDTLKNIQTRVFIVHMTSSIASRFFLKAKEKGMMSRGYAWIITDGLTSLLGCLNSTVIDSMQGVLGVRSLVSPSKTLDDFTVRFDQQFRREYPDIERVNLNIAGLWAYDTAHALAMAAEKNNGSPDGTSQSQQLSPADNSIYDLTSLPVSPTGPKLLTEIKNTRFDGLSGDFRLVDGELHSFTFEIINLVGVEEKRVGYWTRAHGLSWNSSSSKTESADLGQKNITWPGNLAVAPRGWEIPTNGRTLKVGVPLTTGLRKFVKSDNQTNPMEFSGFSIDFFKAVMNNLSLVYRRDYEFVLFGNAATGEQNGTYNDLIYQVYLGQLDAVVADMTITANRLNYVDFTLPYTESGVSMLVAVKDDKRKKPWVFLKPLTLGLWVTTASFFVLTGIVVWILEHPDNPEFQGSAAEQVGTTLWFIFSTMVFAHKERIGSNKSRLVVIIWLFVVLILTSSYTASLTSILTVQQLQPTYKDIDSLIKSGDYVAYTGASFVKELLLSLNIDESKLKNYTGPSQYVDALSTGSQAGGVSAVFDEIPYIKYSIGGYCNKLTMVGPTYKTGGFGFAFPKGSPIISDFNRALLYIKEKNMSDMETRWLGNQSICIEDGASGSKSLTLDSFKGLFLITGTASAAALIIYFVFFIHEHRNNLKSTWAENPSLWQRAVAMARYFDQMDHRYNKSQQRDGSARSEGAIAPVPDNDVGESPSSISNPLKVINTHGDGHDLTSQCNTCTSSL